MMHRSGETLVLMLIILSLTAQNPFGSPSLLTERAYMPLQSFSWSGQTHQESFVFSTDLPTWGAYRWVLDVQATGDKTDGEGYRINLDASDQENLQNIIIKPIHQNGEKYRFQVTFYVSTDEPLETANFNIIISWNANFNFHEGVFVIYETSYIERYDPPTVYNNFIFEIYDEFMLAPLSILQERSMETSAIFRTPEFSGDFRLNLTLKFTVTEVLGDSSAKINVLTAEGIENAEAQNYLLLGSQTQNNVVEGEVIFEWTTVPEYLLYLLNFEIKATGIGEWKISDIEISLSIFEQDELPQEEPQMKKIQFSITILAISISLLYLLPVIKIINTRRKYIKKSKGPIFQIKRNQERL